MAEKLSIQIALEGAEEIKRQLADVGKAGQDAFKQINDAAAEVGGFNKLDPGVVTAKLEQAGITGGKAFDKINTAVKQAGRMETLVGALASVENGLVKVQAAASALDATLGAALVSSIGKIARLLPAAFTAATIGAIGQTTHAILELDAAAIKLGVSGGELRKLRGIFEGLGISQKDAAQGAEAWQAGIDKIDTEKVQRLAADMKSNARGTDEYIRAVWALQAAEKGRGEGARLARKELEAAGLSRKTADEEELSRIQQSKEARSEQMLQAIALFERMGNTIERNRLILATFGQEFGTTLIQALNSGKGVEDIKKKLAGLPPVTEAATQAAMRLLQAWEGFKTLLAEGFTVSPEGLNDVAMILRGLTELLRIVGEGFRLLGEALASTPLANMLRNTVRELETIWQMLTTIAGFGASMWDGIVAGAATAWQTIIGWIDKAIARVKQFFSMGGGQASGAIPDAGGFARGGFVGGRGSGTSDSNLAWLSRGEHVMPAYAVRQPGVLQLLEALRRSGGDLRSVLDRMGHFAMGGMVGPTAMPALAGGGAAAAHRDLGTVRLVLPDGVMVSGLADAKIVEALHRAAAKAQIRSGGRKPSRYS